MKLRGFLLRLLLICVLPLVLLAAYLAWDSLNALRAQRHAEAEDRTADIARLFDAVVRANLNGLQLLSTSAAIDDPQRWPEFRTEALGFHQNFGGHVALVSVESTVLLDTRSEVAGAMTQLPRPSGRAAVPTAIQTGRPAVGDQFLGPIAQEALVAIAVPVLRAGRVSAVLLNTLEASTLQRRLDEVSLPEGWVVALTDSAGAVIARRPANAAAVPPPGASAFVASLELSPWSVALHTPGRLSDARAWSAVAALSIALILVTAASLLAGLLASRRLSQAVASLTSADRARPAHGPVIDEIEEARHALAEAARTGQQAQQTLRDSERRYRELFESNPHPMWVYELETLAFLAVNDAAVSHYGYTQAEFLAMTIRDIRPAEDIARLLTAIPRPGAGFGGGQTWRHCKKNGDLILVEITSHTLDFAGVPAELVLAHDVTLRERASQSLAASESRFRLAIEQAPFPIVMHAEDGEILALSRSWTELSGYALEDIPTIAAWTARAYGERGTAVQEYIAHLYGLTERKAEGEYAIRCKDGSTRLWDFGSVGLGSMPDGRRVAVSMASDVTQRREAEAEVLRYRDRLEELVETRTRELAKARGRAEAANRAKSAFLANISHEIRTPLNAIIGLTFLMKRSSLPADEQRRLDRIEAAGHHLLGIINDVLDLSKIEAGRMELDSSDFQPDEVLQSVRALVAPDAEAKGLRLTVRPPDEPVWLLGDVQRLRQGVLNYAANAVKFTEGGEVTLSATVLDEDEHAVQVRFEVADTGIGIPADKLATLFQTFHQADASTTRRYGGTGLGLAITRRLAELMGGAAGAHSEPGRGSRFWFTARLPRGSAGPATRASSAALDAERLLQTHRQGTHVLLAEDNEVNREIAVALLQSVGFTVDAAADGLQAVEMARQGTYALILMDMQMPGMDGPTAARAIRGLPAYRHVPILAMSASVFSEDRQACVDAGMNDFVAKPADPPALFATLARWLQAPSGPEREVGPGTTRDAPDLAAAVVAEATPITAAEASRLLGLLDGLLSSNDTSSIDFVDRHAAVLRPWLGDRLTAIAASVHRFEFESALRALRSACAAVESRTKAPSKAP